VADFLLYGGLLAAVAACAAGIARQAWGWRRGRPAPVEGRLGGRIARALAEIVAHRRIRLDGVPGLIHAAIFFPGLFLGAAMLWEYVLRAPLPLGPFESFFRFLLDLFGLLLLAGLLAAAARRYLLRPARLEDTRWTDGVALGSLALLVLSGLLLSALRLAVVAAAGGPQPPWMMPGAAVLARVLLRLQGSGEADLGVLAALMPWAYWAHAGITIFLIAWVPFGPLRHIVFSTLNVVLAPYGPKAALAPVDFTAESPWLGARAPDDLTWKQRLDLDACTRCGRCQDRCPASAAGRPLSPKRFLQALRAAAAAPGDETLVPLAVSEEVLWSCTTCGACAEVCPVRITVVDKIVDLRRHLVMAEARAPESAQAALRSLEERGHPWPGTTLTRVAWARDLGVPMLAEAPAAEYLLWVGCTGALVDRNVRATVALARVLQRAGVRFAILGGEETCTGDPARRLGSELLFQMLAQQTVDLLGRSGVRRIITQCAHCYNTLANEYPHFGGRYEVLSHVALLRKLQAAGRLPGGTGGAVVTLHDACYLGRANGIYDEPREVLSGAGLALREMPRRREGSFCCGAGGGNAWISGLPGGKIGALRAREALETGAALVATECPFCLQMLEEGVGDAGGAGRIRPMDVSELLAESLGILDPASSSISPSTASPSFRSPHAGGRA
jgi:Fe-S oxidoreductase/nitrate reductase gamma subunit